MVGDLSRLDCQSISRIENPKRVHLSTGDIPLDTHLGSSRLNGKDTVSGVLYISKFNFNLSFCS